MHSRGSLLVSSSLIHALGLPDRLAWSFHLLMSEKVFYRILLDIHVWDFLLSSFSAKGFGRPGRKERQGRIDYYKEFIPLLGEHNSNPLEKKKAAL